MRTRRFSARVAAAPGGRVVIVIPFDPDEAWGAKAEHPVNGTVNGCRVRVTLSPGGSGWAFILSPSRVRGLGVADGDEVIVELAPEGPQRADLAEDIAAALAANPAAAAFFDTLAQFYRKAYLRWIDATTRRPDLRAARIAEVTDLLAAGIKERPRSLVGPARMPAAEVDVSPDLIRRLLAAQQPDLAGLAIEVMANGWDNVLYRVGDVLLARLPRREMGAALVVHEQRWLPILQPRLPLPVPAPVRTGQPGLGYPWPWSIVPFLPGQAASRNPPADGRDAAISLGRFLAALHTPAPPDAPVNALRGVPLADRGARFTEHLSAAGGVADHRAVIRVWEAALAAPAWDEPPVWLHGDLHPANIVVHHGRISGVIDFGDLTSGDPATDLSVAWMLLPARHHDDFRAAYRSAYLTGGQHAASDDTWARARGWALALSIAMLANSADNPEIAGIGHRTLTAVLA